MSPDANANLSRTLIAEALLQLVGLPLTAFRRAADMATVQFGALRPVDRGSVGDFALHIQSAWRIEGPDGIVTGISDLWEPLDADEEFDPHWHYDKSPNLRDVRTEEWLNNFGPSLIVENVETDDFGGVSIRFKSPFALRIFPSGSRSENWRLFRPKQDGPHFTVAGGHAELRG